MKRRARCGRISHWLPSLVPAGYLSNTGGLTLSAEAYAKLRNHNARPHYLADPLESIS